MLNNKKFKDALVKIKVALFDLDGTIYLGDKVLDGAIDGLNNLRNRGIKIVFVTNNSSRTTEAYISKLKSMGLFSNDDVLTSVKASADFLCSNNLNKRVYCFGTTAVKNELANLGIEVVENNPEVALLLYNKDINYDNICKFNSYISKGVKYIVAQADNVCPAEDVYLPDCGAFIEMFAISSGKRPEIVVGKPNKYMGDTIMKSYNVDSSQVLMVGDRLYTDIRFGKNCGFLTVLVMCGETNVKDLTISDDKPDFCCDNVLKMTEFLK